MKSKSTKNKIDPNSNITTHLDMVTYVGVHLLRKTKLPALALLVPRVLVPTHGTKGMSR